LKLQTSASSNFAAGGNVTESLKRLAAMATGTQDRQPPPRILLKLPERLTKAMKAKGFGERGGKSRLAKKAKMSPGHLSALLDNQRVGGVQAALVIRIANALEVNAGWLLTGHGDMLAIDAPVITAETIRDAVRDGVESGVAQALKKA
jgi:transcriptional regulator with XRE-family HTH domain